MKNSYNIICISDNLYSQHTAVMLTSLFETNINANCNIYLLTTDINMENETKLISIIKKYGNKLIIKRFHAETFNIHNLKTASWHTIMYLKLFIHELLPEDIDKCLFLDVDIIINSPLSELYNINLNNCCIAGCEDNINSMEIKQNLHLYPTDKYINSGVMMINLLKWRELNRKRPIKDFLTRNINIINNDQDAIALYFKEEIKYINDIKWNATTFCFQRLIRVFPKYYNQIENVRKKPAIIHFCDPVKPWYKECKHPYKDLYDKYLKMTPWKNYKYISCKKVYNKSAFYYNFRYWLNYMGIRKDYDFEVPLKRKIKYGIF